MEIFMKNVIGVFFAALFATSAFSKPVDCHSFIQFSGDPHHEIDIYRVQIEGDKAVLGLWSIDEAEVNPEDLSIAFMQSQEKNYPQTLNVEDNNGRFELYKAGKHWNWTIAGFMELSKDLKTATLSLFEGNKISKTDLVCK
jgi:hypothetical protein